MTDLRDILNERLIADGATGTQLLARGLAGECPELWNVERPDVVREVCRAYVDAGSQLVCTNTFGASQWKLDRSGHAADQERFCNAAAENALAAADGKAYVLADIGPTGELPEPFGAHSIDEFEVVFAAQIELLAKAGVHGVIIETMSSADEGAAAVRAAKRACGLPVIACMTYSAGNAGYRTMMGETVAQAAEKLLDAGADVVGSNCGLGIGQMAEVVGEIKAVTSGPVIAKPNAGRPRLVDGETVFEESAADWAPKVSGLVEAGANIVGGCCGTTPDHIARACSLLNG
ncbi:MAG: homocysteine S-methyltransferase family protein [Planctomycetota bacterium]